MLRRWSSVVFRRRRLVLALSGLSLLVAIVAMIAAGGSSPRAGSTIPIRSRRKSRISLLDVRPRLQMVFIFDAGNGFRSAVRPRSKSAGAAFKR